MLKLTRVADVGVELLPLVLAPLAAIRFEQVPAVFCEDDGTLVLVDGDEADQPLVPKVLQGVVLRSGIPVVDAFEVSLSGHPERADGRQREAVFTVQLVEVLAVVLHQLALKPAGQFQALYERVAWVVAPRVVVTLEVPFSIRWVARIVKPAHVVDVDVVAVA